MARIHLRETPEPTIATCVKEIQEDWKEIKLKEKLWKKEQLKKDLEVPGLILICRNLSKETNLDMPTRRSDLS